MIDPKGECVAVLRARRRIARLLRAAPRPFVGFVIACALLLGLARPALADGKSDVDAAEQAYMDLDFDGANKAAERAMAQRGLTHDQLVRACRVLARTYAVLDQVEKAREAFKLLLAYEPEEKDDPNLTPKVQAAMIEARGFWRGQAAKPGIDLVANVRAHQSATIRYTLRDPTHIAVRVLIGHRWGSQGPFVIANTTGPAGAAAIPAPPANATTLEYYAQALDERDNPVFELGDAKTPKTALVPATEDRLPPKIGGPSGPGVVEKKKSIFSSPVFWIVAGAVVLGGATTAFVATRGKDDVMLPPTQANFSPALFCGAEKCR